MLEPIRNRVPAKPTRAMYARALDTGFPAGDEHQDEPRPSGTVGAKGLDPRGPAQRDGVTWAELSMSGKMLQSHRTDQNG